MNMRKDVGEFLKKFELGYSGPPTVLSRESFEVREKLLIEELNEWSESMRRLHLELSYDLPNHFIVEEELDKQLDALIDLIYVAMGNVHLQGFDKIFRKAWKRVHKANMSKVRVSSAKDSKRGSTLDVMKPEGWKSPSHRKSINKLIRKSM